MKSKKTKKSRRKTSRGQKIVYIIYLVIAFVSCFFFFKSYQYISNIPKANNMTQEEIYDLTRINESDIKLVRALKNNAFDSWLYEANSDKVKQLQKTEATVSSITEGKVKVSEVDQTITDLKKEVDIINESDIEELYVLYYKQVLPKQYEKAETDFQKMTAENPEEHYKEIFSLLDLLNKIYNQKGMLAVTTEDSFRKSTTLLEEIDKNFQEVNQIKSLVVSYEILEEPISTPETRLGMELDKYVLKTNDYLQANLMVTEFERKYSELQDNLATNKQLIKKSVEIPDLVGLTVEQAQRELSKAKLNSTIYGYTNKLYKNGDIVPESKRGIETWDDDKQAKITSQEPSRFDYEYIIQGSTIKVIVENKPTEKPKETITSSSSSTSDTSTSQSDSTDTTTSTTTSSDENKN
ncbi:PASTA domain-containing protein [Vagococcus hydrophili]|uniref:PASTA domain-containing protein n=1 Tax=Vagococcus hydrophili TaxID=2714947 RepID=A0A6G8AUA0_9ENTE|nr:PASTA domain-containing protein [Vagococcus hydrophili]QIL48522.1 hypothetical protein G7082_08425 [Vagococcus hydrophili]